MSIGSDFDTFNRNFEVDNVETIRSRYRAITRRINLDWNDSLSETANSLYLGSYSRNTAIRGFSDLDMAVLLPMDYWYSYESRSGNGQSALLQAVKETLRGEYPRTDLRGDGQVVVVQFADGMRFEIVPMFESTTTVGSYWYADTNGGGSWKLAFPKEEQAAFFAINRERNGNAVKLGRMVRAWRRENNVMISGVLIDTLVARFLQTYRNADKSSYWYGFMCRDFFEYLALDNPYGTFWRSLDDRYYIERTGAFESKAESARHKAVLACAAYDSDPAVGRSFWRDIFGDFFPS